MRRIFISYAHADAALVRPLYAALEQAGFTTELELAPGQAYSGVLKESIEGARRVVVIWSRAAAKSEFVRAEIGVAIRAWTAGRLILARADDTPLPLGLRDFAAIDLAARSEEGIAQIVRSAQTDGSDGGPPPPSASSPPPPAPPASNTGAAGPQATAAPPAGQHVFISYSRRDGQTVDRLTGEIERSGHPVWIDRRAGAHASPRYAGPIVAAIRSSRVVAVMGSENSFASDHVVRELYVAGDFRRPFLAFLLDDTAMPDEFLYFLSGFPRIPARKIEPAALRSVIGEALS